jgi:hypothetical protein
MIIYMRLRLYLFRIVYAVVIPIYGSKKYCEGK